MKKFAIIGFIMVAVKALDLWTASLFTPDFSLTVSPLIGVLPVWGFLAVQIIVLLGMVFCLYFFLNRRFAAQPAGFSFAEYWNMTVYDREKVGIDWLKKLPKNWTPFLSLLGFIFIFAGIPVGLLATASNLLCRSNPGYLEFYIAAGRRLFTVLSFALAIGSMPVFLIVEYRKYLKTAKAQD
jgi:hypothetical protein